MSLRFGVGRKRGGFVSPRRKPPEELSQYLLFSSFRQRGQFWLAGRKDFALSGELQFQGGGRVTLHLDGHFDQDRGLHFNKPESVIWGQLNDGALCCILGYYG